MSNNEILLLDQIDRLINLQQWSTGIFITIIFFIASIIGVVQYKFSEKRINNLKNEIETELLTKYKLDNVLNIEKDSQYSIMLSNLFNAEHSVNQNQVYESFRFLNESAEYLNTEDTRAVSLYLLKGYHILLSINYKFRNDEVKPNEKRMINSPFVLDTLKHYTTILESYGNNPEFETGFNIKNISDLVNSLIKRIGELKPK